MLILLDAFQASIWGTVSDWAMVAITAFSVYFLIKTFLSQQAVQKMQLKLTKIENEKYRLANLPRFTVELGKTMPLNRNDDSTSQFMELILTLHDSHVKECRYTLLGKNCEVVHSASNVYSGSNVEQGSINIIEFSCKIESQSYDSTGFTICVNIHFTDPVDNYYEQFFDLEISQGMTRINSDITPIYKFF